MLSRIFVENFRELKVYYNLKCVRNVQPILEPVVIYFDPANI